MLTMFVYGTLKRGERNHERFCSGALRVEEGAVRGELYDLPLFGYPELVVPEESVRAFGTDDAARDAELQERLARGRPSTLEGPRVFGEIFFFDDADPAFRRSTGWKGSTRRTLRATTGASCYPSNRKKAGRSWRGPTWSGSLRNVSPGRKVAALAGTGEVCIWAVCGREGSNPPTGWGCPGLLRRLSLRVSRGGESWCAHPRGRFRSPRSRGRSACYRKLRR